MPRSNSRRRALTQEQEQLKISTRRLLESVCTKEWRDGIEAREEYPFELHQRMSEAGLFGIAVPNPTGGPEGLRIAFALTEPEAGSARRLDPDPAQHHRPRNGYPSGQLTDRPASKEFMPAWIDRQLISETIHIEECRIPKSALLWFPAAILRY